MLSWDNGKENGSYYIIIGHVILGLWKIERKLLYYDRVCYIGIMTQLLGLGQGSAESAATTPGLRVPGSVCCPVHLLHDIQRLRRMCFWA